MFLQNSIFFWLRYHQKYYITHDDWSWCNYLSIPLNINWSILECHLNWLDPPHSFSILTHKWLLHVSSSPNIYNWVYCESHNIQAHTFICSFHTSAIVNPDDISHTQRASTAQTVGNSPPHHMMGGQNP